MTTNLEVRHWNPDADETEWIVIEKGKSREGWPEYTARLPYARLDMAKLFAAAPLLRTLATEMVEYEEKRTANTSALDVLEAWDSFVAQACGAIAATKASTAPASANSQRVGSRDRSVGGEPSQVAVRVGLESALEPKE